MPGRTAGHRTAGQPDSRTAGQPDTVQPDPGRVVRPGRPEPLDASYAAVARRPATCTASASVSTTGTPTPSRLARLCDPPV